MKRLKKWLGIKSPLVKDQRIVSTETINRIGFLAYTPIEKATLAVEEILMLRSKPRWFGKPKEYMETRYHITGTLYTRDKSVFHLKYLSKPVSKAKAIEDYVDLAAYRIAAHKHRQHFNLTKVR